MSSLPIPNVYWVIPGRFIAGQYPGAQQVGETRLRLRWLLEQGVTACIDLTEAGKSGLNSYAPAFLEEAASIGVNARHIRHTIQDFSTPSVEQMNNILDDLNLLLENGEVVYVHCHGGIGRTGTVVACYLVRHGLTGEAALARLDFLRKDTPAGWIHSPETDDQCLFVLDWGKWDAALKNSKN